jgi:hypothetical protein
MRMTDQQDPWEQAAIAGQMGQPVPPAPPRPGTSGAYGQVANAYQQQLGRPGSEQEIWSHLGGGRATAPQNVSYALGNIARSPEAANYRAAPTAAPPAAPPPASGGAGAPPSGKETPWGGSPYGYEGFDFNRAQNVEKSAKDAFAFYSSQAPPPPLQDKGALGQWFQQYIAPKMNEAGHRIDWVEGDKFQFTNWQGTFVVDFGRGAGADGASLAWQADYPGGGGGGGGAVPGAPGGAGAAAGLGGMLMPQLTDDSFYQRLLEEVRRLASGQNGQMDLDGQALAGMMGGLR